MLNVGECGARRQELIQRTNKTANRAWIVSWKAMIGGQNEAGMRLSPPGHLDREATKVANVLRHDGSVFRCGIKEDLGVR